jgi:thymidylate synthase (FAD)
MDEMNHRLERTSVPALEAMLGERIPVLDQGFIRVVDYLGSDQSIVQAARVSYGRGTKTVKDDRELIRYLMRHDHTSPFEMCDIKLHLRVPMDCWRQWIRHRTASVNEYSTRYSIAIDAALATLPGGWRRQAVRNRQGSEGQLDEALGAELSREESELQEHCRRVYSRRLELGVAREQARKDLPLSTYTEAYWKIDLHNLFNFLYLRLDAKAQLEIRLYAQAIGQRIVAVWCPLAWEAFQDYRLKMIKLSAAEQSIIGLLAKGQGTKAMEEAERLGFLAKGREGYKRSLECQELEDKLPALGLAAPWLKAE